MTRQKIIFLIVLGAVALFIASMVGSMFARKLTLPNGYEISVGGKGETWLRSPDRRVLVTDVTSVWTSAGRMVVERHTTDDKPPFKDLGCDYQVAEGRGALRSIPLAEAQTMLAGMERQTASAKSCVR